MRVLPRHFKPSKTNESDKFSCNVYKWLSKHSGMDIQVMRVGWNNINGKCALDDGGLYFVIDGGGWPVTARINRVASVGPKEGGCVLSWGGNPWSALEKEDVTEWFFREYSRVGRCLFSNGWSHDFVSINKNSRKCKHCKKIETRSVITKKKITRFESWS